MIAFATDEIDTDRVDNEKMQWINQQVDRCKNEELELQMVSLSAENQKLQRSVDLFQRRVDAMQCETRDLETENVKLQKTVEGKFPVARFPTRAARISRYPITPPESLLVPLPRVPQGFGFDFCF